MKMALVHDHLLEFGGAERVFFALKHIFPDSDIYTAAYNNNMLKKHVPESANWKINSSWASRIPFFSKLYSPLRFLTPWIWESFDLTDYDVVISSSGWFMSKGVITKDQTLHVCYLHHQPRYLYYYETAVEWQKYFPVKIYAHFINHFLRIWDFQSSQRPDYFIANSHETKKRIQKFYRRDSEVIYPPVDIPKDEVFKMQKFEKRDYYVTLSRLSKTKNIDVLIKTANELKIKLKIVGVGRDEEYLRSLAGDSIEFLGRVSDEKFGSLYQGSKAFLFASVDEEFGIAPVEAMGYGVPVIAYASGGLKETVKDGYNGYLYNKLHKRYLIEKIKELELLSNEDYMNMAKNARKEAEKYSYKNFEKNIKKFINTCNHS
ncbi:hypothetical protein A3C24_00715 [Candidatus Roizmanbacteria bacterium RIFCSPHIGHO2_02_FULL_37_24]|uniref:Glycosyl transferase family 1 domain-containing protein n=1 Tax=Candidatus Roizmanbacteria bacterium RIFCSPHIGHO2_02_FULL_37_24 TaxID=1802037 RepID=A0A1F7H0M7_9BACT|nr:MAG: hypothetical protein A3C24_00715 [Candidatus Roizmanbacteria bacterium RIFCSPHIGHO2_02_FULL_37_24]